MSSFTDPVALAGLYTALGAVVVAAIAKRRERAAGNQVKSRKHRSVDAVVEEYDRLFDRMTAENERMATEHQREIEQLTGQISWFQAQLTAVLGRPVTPPRRPRDDR